MSHKKREQSDLGNDQQSIDDQCTTQQKLIFCKVNMTGLFSGFSSAIAKGGKFSIKKLDFLAWNNSIKNKI